LISVFLQLSCIFHKFITMPSQKRNRIILQQYGLKITSARLRVLDTLMRSEAALSHSDILSRIGESRPDKVTLYRTLDAFVKSGLAHKVATEERNWLYALDLAERSDAALGTHAHFVCDHCERIYCLPVAPLSGIKIPGAAEGFVMRSHEYRIHGTCPQCH
jgi:Fur family transcriptional regulator, ferric uptake regulator